MKIKQTKDYSLFQSVKGNREINKRHVNKLAKSITEENLSEFIPVIVNEDMEVIDGQHRIEVAKSLGLPVFYTVVDEAGLSTIQKLNSYNKSWGVKDFVESYRKLGNQDYEVLTIFSETYNLPITLSAAILIGTSLGGGRTSEKIREGNFKVGNLKNAERIGNTISEYRNYVDKGISRSTKFIQAIISISKLNISQKRMMKKLSYLGKKLVPQVSTRDYVRELERIYNFKNGQDNTVRFF